MKPRHTRSAPFLLETLTKNPRLSLSIAGFGLVVVFILFWGLNAYIKSLIDLNAVQSHLESATGRPVQIGASSVDLFGVHLKNVALSNDSGLFEPALISAEAVELDYRLWPLLQRKLVISRITLSNPALQLNLNPDGTTSLTPVFQHIRSLPPSDFAVRVRRITFSNARIEFRDSSETAPLPFLSLAGIHADVRELDDEDPSFSINMRIGRINERTVDHEWKGSINPEAFSFSLDLSIDSLPPVVAEFLPDAMGKLSFADMHGDFTFSAGGDTFALSGLLGFDSFRLQLKDQETPISFSQLESEGTIRIAPEGVNIDLSRLKADGSEAALALQSSPLDNPTSLVLNVNGRIMTHEVLAALPPEWTKDLIDYRLNGPMDLNLTLDERNDETSITGTLEPVNLSVALPQISSPLQEVRGRVLLRNSRYELEALSFNLNGLRAAVTGVWNSSDDYRLTFTGPAVELETLRQTLPSEWNKIPAALSVQNPFRLEFNISQAQDRPSAFRAVATLGNNRVDWPGTLQKSFENISGPIIIESDTVTFQDLAIATRLQPMLLSGTVNTKSSPARLNLSLRSEGAEISDVLGLLSPERLPELPDRTTLSGPLEIRLSVRGPTGNAAITGTLSPKGIAIANPNFLSRPLANVTGRIRLEERLVVIENLRGEVNANPLVVNGVFPKDADTMTLKITAQRFPVGEILPLLPAEWSHLPAGLLIRDNVDFFMEARGRKDAPQISGEITFLGNRIQHDTFFAHPLENVQGKVTLTGANLVIDALSFRMGASALNLSGVVQNYGSENTRLDMTLKSSDVDLGIVTTEYLEGLRKLFGEEKPLLPEGLTLSGHSSIDLNLKGPADDLSFNGSFVLNNAQIKLPFMLQPFRNLRGNIRLTPNLFTAESLVFTVGQTSGRFTGVVENFESPRINTRFSSSALSFSDLQNAFAPEKSPIPETLRLGGLANVDIACSGPINNLNFDGAVILQNASVQVQGFNLPIEQINGTFNLSGKSVAIAEEITGRIGSTGTQVYLAGRINNVYTRDLDIRFSSGQALGIDFHDLLEALPVSRPEQREKLRAIGLSGSGDIHAHLTGRPGVNGDPGTLKITGNITSADATVFGINFQNLAAAFVHQGQTFDFTNLEAVVFGGDVSGSIELDLKSNPQRPIEYAVNLRLSNVKLREALARVSDNAENYRGILDGRISITGTGDDLNTINGSGNIELTDGKLDALRLARNLAGFLSAGASVFSSSGGENGRFVFKIQNGWIIHSNEVAGTEDMVIHGPNEKYIIVIRGRTHLDTLIEHQVTARIKYGILGSPGSLLSLIGLGNTLPRADDYITVRRTYRGTLNDPVSE